MTTVPEYRLSLDFTAADGLQASRLAAAWADTCAAEYGTRYRGIELVGGQPSTHPVDVSAVACEWCGRAIRQEFGSTWSAVKGVERGYNPTFCDVADNSFHAPSASGTYPLLQEDRNE